MVFVLLEKVKEKIFTCRMWQCLRFAGRTALNLKYLSTIVFLTLLLPTISTFIRLFLFYITTCALPKTFGDDDDKRWEWENEALSRLLVHS